MGNVYGRYFKVATFGESHGGALGCVIDGCPPNVEITADEIQAELARRAPGQSDISTARTEKDICEILSGILDGRTLGTPICVIVRNTDQHSSDYSEIAKLWRPSHADFTYDAKYGIRDARGGGRSSARETVGRVIAGVFARKVLACRLKKSVTIRAWVESVHAISMPARKTIPSLAEVEATPVRCPDKTTAAKMTEFIKKAKAEGDSVGGVIRCAIDGLPAGLGDPVFDRFEAELAKAMLSIPATKAFEIGSGFAGTRMFGSMHNDLFELDNDGNATTATNNAGGVLGGITSGRPVEFRVAFKPTATIAKQQRTLDKQLNVSSVIGKGRHDPCVVPRAVPIVEAMAALVCVDSLFSQTAIRPSTEGLI